jgi:hypothetical protein
LALVLSAAALVACSVQEGPQATFGVMTESARTVVVDVTGMT